MTLRNCFIFFPNLYALWLVARKCHRTPWLQWLKNSRIAGIIEQIIYKHHNVGLIIIAHPLSSLTEADLITLHRFYDREAVVPVDIEEVVPCTGEGMIMMSPYLPSVLSDVCCNMCELLQDRLASIQEQVRWQSSGSRNEYNEWIINWSYQPLRFSGIVINYQKSFMFIGRKRIFASASL